MFPVASDQVARRSMAGPLALAREQVRQAHRAQDRTEDQPDEPGLTPGVAEHQGTGSGAWPNRAPSTNASSSSRAVGADA